MRGDTFMDIPEELRHRIDNLLEWHRNGNIDASAAAINSIHEIVGAGVPSAIGYLLSTAPKSVLKCTGKYLNKLKTWNFLMCADIGVGAEEANKRSLARQPLYQEVYQIFCDLKNSPQVTPE
jgi:hypothetical protein